LTCTRFEAVIARYRTVLSVPGSARLYATALFARLPQGMGALSILLLVRDTTHSYTLAGLATGGAAAAQASAAPLQGRLVDRFGRTRVLTPCSAMQACSFVALVLSAQAHLPGVVLVVLACGVGGFQPAIAPVVRSLLRTIIVDHDVRETAYSLEAVIQELIWMAGPLLVALVVTVGSPSSATLLCAGVSLVGTVSFVASPASRGTARVRQASRPGATVLRTNRQLRNLLIPIGLMGIALGATDVGIPSLALHAGSRGDSGVLLAAWSAGSMVGGLFYGSHSWGLPLAERYRRLLMLAVLCAIPLTLADSIGLGLIASVVAGLTIAPVFSCQYALVGRTVTDGAETEAFTWVSAALVAGIAGGAALGGATIGAVGVSAPFLLACLALAVAATTSVRARQLARVVA
jgi:MFS family permease